MMGMTRHIVIAERETDAREAAEQAYRRWRSSFMNLWDKHGINPTSVSFPESFDGVIEAGIGMAGTPAQVRDFVWRQIEDAGINYFVCRFAFGNLPLEILQNGVELFAREVAPAFKTAA